MASNLTASEQEELRLAQEIIRRYNEGENISPEDLRKATQATSRLGIRLQNGIERIGSSMAQFGQSVTRTVQSQADGVEGLTAYSDVTRSLSEIAASVASNIPGAGRTLEALALAAGKVIIAVQKTGDAQFKAYRELSSSGLSIGMTDTFNNLHSAGYTMAEMGKFTEIMKKNSTIFAAMGGSAADGAKQFVDISASIKDSGLEAQYRNMGMSVDDINNSVAQYIKFQQLSGSSKRQTTQELTDGAAALIDQQDRFAKLTGINAEAQNKANEKALAEEQMAAKNAELQEIVDRGGPEAEIAKKEMERNRELISFADEYAKGHGEGLTKVLSGAINDPAYQQFAFNFPKATEAIQKGLLDSVEVMQLMQKDAKISAYTNSQLAIGGFSDKLFGPYSSTVKLAGTNLDNMTAARENAHNKQIAQKQGLIDSSTQNMAKMNQAQRDVIQDIDNITNRAILPLVKVSGSVSETTAKLTDIIKNMASNSSLLSSFSGSAISGGSTPAGGAGLGSLSAQYESGREGSAAIGYDSTGGTSYGKYQIASNTGSMDEYLKFLEKSNPEAAAKLRAAGPSNTGSTSGKFADTWKELAQSGALGTSEHDYIKSTKYDPGIRQLKDDALKRMIDGNSALQDVAWSTIVQHGATGGSTIMNNAYKTGMSAEDFVKAVYAIRGTQFGSSAANVQASVRQRFVSEQSETLGRLRAPAQAANTEPLQQGAMGGLLSGPIDGFIALLHGTEAVIPMPDGEPINVESGEGDDNNILNDLMELKMQKVDTLIRNMTTYMRNSDRLLQLQS